MSTPAAGGEFSVDLEAMSRAQTVLNGMAMDSRNLGAGPNGSTNAAAGAHSGWETAAALRDALAEWDRQADDLNTRLHRDSAALEQSRQNYERTNESLADRLRRA
ncbi:hypothetical protein [Kitasatospora sp. NPDC057198]|uniref:hypothetical protein n=1 Tax=Kitasatospora sp. NPDC057198 TaxID=3346046 RepID=UPI003642796B